MTEEGHLPNSWADVACSPLKLGMPAVGMIKPVTLTPLKHPPAYESQKAGPGSPLYRRSFCCAWGLWGLWGMYRAGSAVAVQVLR